MMSMSPPAVTKTPRLKRSFSLSASHSSCTHLIMTRLYSMDFRCQVCLRTPSTGWLYRCIEDRELTMEAEFQGGTLEKLDSLCDIFGPIIGPKKRGPDERANKLAFFDEIDDLALKSYNPKQLSTILNQRSQVIDIAREKSTTSYFQDTASYNKSEGHLCTLLKGSRASPAQADPDGAAQKPWTPKEGTECQFKCCHFCRPNMAERAYLNLNSIVNGDIPLTAAYGFGFHLSKPNGRPVMDAEIVKNLGLRPDPPTRTENSMFSTQDHSFSQSHIPQDLGILQPGHPLPAIPTTLNALAHHLPASSFATRYGNCGPDPSFEELGSFNSQSQDITEANVALSAANFYMTQSNRPLFLRQHSSEHTKGRPSLEQRLAKASLNVRFEAALLIPLPDQTAEELNIIGAPLTPTEMSGMDCQFGEESWKVSDGIAVTEEAVEMHTADIIT